MASRLPAARGAGAAHGGADSGRVRGADAGRRHGNRALCRRHRRLRRLAVCRRRGGESRIARDFGLGFAGVCGARLRRHHPAIGLGPGAMRCLLDRAVRRGGARRSGPCSRSPSLKLPIEHGQRPPRVARPACCGAGARVVVSLFPQCLAAPYADLDPRLKELWLDHIDEAQSLFTHRRQCSRPRVAARYVTPLVAHRADGAAALRAAMAAPGQPRRRLAGRRFRRQRLAGARLDILDRASPSSRCRPGSPNWRAAGRGSPSRGGRCAWPQPGWCR